MNATLSIERLPRIPPPRSAAGRRIVATAPILRNTGAAVLPTFSTQISGAATRATAARRQNARTNMSFDFHGVISSHQRPCPSHVDWPAPCRPVQLRGSGAATAAARRRNDGQSTCTHMCLHFHDVISCLCFRAHRTSIGRPHVDPTHETSIASAVTTMRKLSCSSISATRLGRRPPAVARCSAVYRDSSSR
jgi:hypothetical protein